MSRCELCGRAHLAWVEGAEAIGAGVFCLVLFTTGIGTTPLWAQVLAGALIAVAAVVLGVTLVRLVRRLAFEVAVAWGSLRGRPSAPARVQAPRPGWTR